MESQRLERDEYQMIAGRISAAEGAVVNVYGGTLVASISLIAALAAYSTDVQETFPSSKKLPLAMSYLLPIVLLIPALLLIASLRRALIRYAMYLRVFFDEVEVYGTGYEIRLHELRHRLPGESLNHVPLCFWAVFAVSAALYCHAIMLLSASLWPFFLVLLPLGTLLAVAHRNFNRALNVSLAAYHDAWRSVRLNEPVRRRTKMAQVATEQPDTTGDALLIVTQVSRD